jgi:hypothetical protein
LGGRPVKVQININLDKILKEKVLPAPLFYLRIFPYI